MNGLARSGAVRRDGHPQTDGAEVLCPITIPELLAKHCIILTDDGCVLIHVSHFGLPSDPDGVFVNTCPEGPPTPG